MEYYFFRDVDNNGNFINDKSYHSAGYVEKLYCEIGSPNESGKDAAVTFFDPFDAVIIRAWRSLEEIELFIVDGDEYENLVECYNKIMAL